MQRSRWPRFGATVLAVMLCSSPLNAQAPPSPEPYPRPNARIVSRADVSGVPGKEGIVLSVEWPPGARLPRHYHHGDEFAYVVDGTLELRVDGQPPLTVHAGESYHNVEGVVHQTLNVGPGIAHSVTVYVVDKGKPVTEPAP